MGCVRERGGGYYACLYRNEALVRSTGVAVLWDVRGSVVVWLIEAGMGVYIEHSKYISFTR